MEKKILISLFLACICFIAFIFLGHKNNKPVCTISGVEYEYINIDDKQYEVCENAPFDYSDKSKKIGKIKSGELTFTIYSIKGTDEYLYCRWDWEGRIYKLIKD